MQISNKQFGGSMEIKIGIASLAKSGAEYCGDSYSLVERLGGMTLILSDGHGNTAADICRKRHQYMDSGPCIRDLDCGKHHRRADTV